MQMRKLINLCEGIDNSNLTEESIEDAIISRLGKIAKYSQQHTELLKAHQQAIIEIHEQLESLRHNVDLMRTASPDRDQEGEAQPKIGN